MKKIPLRTCVICREKQDKRDMKRIVCNKENEVFYDPTGKANGRGAYICQKDECLDAFLKQSILERAFKRPFDRETTEKVRKELIDE